MMLFTEFELDDRLQRALATARFVSPTPIQAAALPVAMAGRDLVGTAQTGTGKTAAFLLPILQGLISAPLEARKTRALILAPTRELVEQILAMARELGVHTNVRSAAVYGGVPMHQQTRALRNGVELVIACPGRLLDHIKRRNTDLRQVDCLVLDEADRMLDMGFLPSIQEIIDAVPVERQTMLYSATFAKSLNAFVKQTLRNPARVEVDNAAPARTVPTSSPLPLRARRGRRDSREPTARNEDDDPMRRLMPRIARIAGATRRRHRRGTSDPASNSAARVRPGSRRDTIGRFGGTTMLKRTSRRRDRHVPPMKQPPDLPGRVGNRSPGWRQPPNTTGNFPRASVSPARCPPAPARPANPPPLPWWRMDPHPRAQLARSEPAGNRDKPAV